ncbi:MAG: DUF3237 domain-containing protein [Sneathiella sp.]|uniref:DUF3237 domain-containing protein n=1 Tax=Sneathiella sp. TaxID=1964365 RepID=UPI0030025694
MIDLSLTPAFDMHLNVKMPLTNLGKTPYGDRLIAEVTGGEVTGPMLSGKVHAGGGDWLLLRNDGVMQLDVRLTIEADDGSLIYVTYRGLRHGPKEVMDRMAKGEVVDPDEYYFKIAPIFETSAETHDWLNKNLFVANGVRNPAGPTYHVFLIE